MNKTAKGILVPHLGRGKAYCTGKPRHCAAELRYSSLPVLLCVAPGNNVTSQVLFPPLKNENESKCLPKLLQEKWGVWCHMLYLLNIYYLPSMQPPIRKEWWLLQAWMPLPLPVNFIRPHCWNCQVLFKCLRNYWEGRTESIRENLPVQNTELDIFLRLHHLIITIFWNRTYFFFCFCIDKKPRHTVVYVSTYQKKGQDEWN